MAKVRAAGHNKRVATCDNVKTQQTAGHNKHHDPVPGDNVEQTRRKNTQNNMSLVINTSKYFASGDPHFQFWPIRRRNSAAPDAVLSWWLTMG